ncbi:MAG: hypothetical protein CBC35_01335 [Planctomycetes bacterium TMED75]|nr:hypothetical protein [Planctomycetaceae bacterium]OUU96445.1 MAG: hypothetical protein CBC35_01335 [Planctomycetes bacterium TMED75]
MEKRTEVISPVAKIRQEFNSFSNGTRVLVLVGIASLILLGVGESWRVANELNAETDELLVQIDRARTAQSGLRPAFRDQVQSMGEVRLPTSKLSTIAAEQKLYVAVNQILERNKAQMVAISISPGANLPNSAAPEIPRAVGQKLAKIVARLEFDCEHTAATRILKELELNPEVYSITRMQITRYDSGPEQTRGMVNVDITLESWVLKNKINRRGN